MVVVLVSQTAVGCMTQHFVMSKRSHNALYAELQARKHLERRAVKRRKACEQQYRDHRETIAKKLPPYLIAHFVDTNRLTTYYTILRENCELEPFPGRRDALSAKHEWECYIELDDTQVVSYCAQHWTSEPWTLDGIELLTGDEFFPGRRRRHRQQAEETEPATDEELWSRAMQLNMNDERAALAALTFSFWLLEGRDLSALTNTVENDGRCPLIVEQ